MTCKCRVNILSVEKIIYAFHLCSTIIILEVNRLRYVEFKNETLENFLRKTMVRFSIV